MFVSWVMLGMINRVMDRLVGTSDLSAINWDVKKSNPMCITEMIAKSLLLL